MRKYRDDMTAAEISDLLAELDALDAAYSDAARFDESQAVPCDEEWEDDDPRRMGWVDSYGRP